METVIVVEWYDPIIGAWGDYEEAESVEQARLTCARLYEQDKVLGATDNRYRIVTTTTEDFSS